jgi:hypothetical protein
MSATVTFASLRAHLIVVESPAQPVFSNGRQIRTDPGKYHEFIDHRCVVKGDKSVAFLRDRISAPDGPEAWELEADDVPEVTGLLSELATADTDRVREILDAERKTSKRQVILETSERILQRAGVSERKQGQKVVAG